MDTVNEFSASPEERLSALRALIRDAPPRTNVVEESNNHIHTCYSFSPYTPSSAALGAYRAGLAVAGSVDHDSLAAASEMRQACAMLGMGCVTGFEIRVFLRGRQERDRAGKAGRAGPAGASSYPAGAGASEYAGPPRYPAGESSAGASRYAGVADFLSGKKINNPDSAGIIYITVQGVPEGARGRVRSFLEPVRVNRYARTAKMARRANEILANAGIGTIDFEKDVAARSKFSEGGTITERHLLAAMAEVLIAGFGRGEPLAKGIESRLSVALKPKVRASLSDPANPYLMYDLLGVLKAEFLPTIFIQPEAECVDAKAAVDFAVSVGAIPAYAYLGDVGESPTGDKKAEKFEDDFLPELFAELKRLGFLAVTYMPPRNTKEQLLRVRTLCKEFGFMEISGVDINQPRQSFNCPELRLPEFAHLNAATWAMVAHETLGAIDPALCLFSAANPYAGLGLEQRIAVYSRAGLDMIRGGRQTPATTPAAVAESLRKGRYEL